MKHIFYTVSLMLTLSILLLVHLLYPHYQSTLELKVYGFVRRDEMSATDKNSQVATLANPCTGDNCIDARTLATDSSCAMVNGSKVVSGSLNRTWVVLCDTDFVAQNIFPFSLVPSFEECLQQCDNYNRGRSNGCAGIVFAPDRVNDTDDCYLKSSVNDALTNPATYLIAATLIPQSHEEDDGDGVGSVSPSSAALPSSGGDMATTARRADVAEVVSLGTSTNNPVNQYVSHIPAFPVKLAKTQLEPGINLDLIRNYPLAADTGSWTEATVPPMAKLADMSVEPRFSRDGGKGGSVNGTHVFVFCDTSTYDTTGMNGLVSSSAVVDQGQQAVFGSALALEDPLGQFQDDVGRLRGWIEMTTGEEAFNIAVSGDGFRYAVWPQSSFISLNITHSLIYAALVYLQVNMTSQDSNFTSLGNSLVAVTIDPVYGPHASRLVNQLFLPGQVEWGSLGGFRAWGASGNGTNEGLIYLFGQVSSGVSVARVSPNDITELSLYEYWDGNDWSDAMPGNYSQPFLINQEVMDFDLFYSPYHQYFFMVYLTPFADNTFYYRYTLTPASDPIIPPYVPGGDNNYGQRMLRDPWSEPQVLYQPSTPEVGYIYAGGCHLGYFGADDITEGGHYLLITWTEHTVKDPNDPSSGYALKAAKIKLGYEGVDNVTVT